jgi:hypothetical protein
MNRLNKLVEGQKITQGNMTVTLLNITGLDTCKIKITTGNQIRTVFIHTNRAVRLLGRKIIYLESISDLHKATIVIGDQLQVKSIADKANKEKKAYDITNIEKWLEEAIPSQNGEFNYRNDYWLFKVRGNQLLDVYLSNCPDCQDTKKIHVHDECHHCYGVGCNHCNHVGTLKKKITCQTCKSNKYLTNHNHVLKYKTQSTNPRSEEFYA